MARPRLLYITPVIPALTGNGLAMRAGAVLEALAHRHEVHLLVTPLYASVTPAIPECFAALSRRAAIVSPRSVAPWSGERFDIVHIFRLAALPFARPYLGGRWRRARRHLDLDDIESVTHRRIAALHRRNGDPAMAAFEENQAARQEAVERQALAACDRIYVCSAADKAALEQHARTAIRVLPNAVRLPPAVADPPSDSDFTFLFVGTLGYYPNEDAARWLCSAIVPRLGELAVRRFAVHIAGTGASDALRQAIDRPPVRFLGQAGDLAPCYGAAHAVVAPIRAGGGTRIKILEAFAYRRPVVATAMAMEGIEARPGEHFLPGDTPEEFARQCASLLADPGAGAPLAREAHALLLRSYTIEALIRALND